MTCKTIDGLSLCEAVAENYRSSLPKGRGGTVWTIETFSHYAYLKKQIKIIDDIWKGATIPLKALCLVCSHEWDTRASNIQQGVGCPECAKKRHSNLAGIKRIKPSTQGERDKAKELREQGLSYLKIANELNRSSSGIQRWLNPEYKAMQTRVTKKCREGYKKSGHMKKINASYKNSEHGKAMNKGATSKRRLLKTNSPEEVLLDGIWYEVDMKATYKIWGELLLPYDDQQAINELYRTCDLRTKRTGIMHHLDHIQPLSKGGVHLPINLQIITAEENLRKGTTFRNEDQELLASRYFNIN
tara:strand:+ start:673 stop:1575 length:903 start_codon:yes stop_codon:yes gene_type:complete